MHMELSDILRLTQELIQLRDDRMQMSFEDDRSHLCRSLEQASKKIERLTKCLKSASDDYDVLMKIVLNATNSNNSKKRSADEVLEKQSSKVRIADKHCLSPVKLASPQKSVANNHVVSSMKKPLYTSPVTSATAPAATTNEDCSPESVDCLNPVGQGGYSSVAPVPVAIEQHYGPDSVSSSSSKSAASFNIVSKVTRDVNDILPLSSGKGSLIPAPLVIQSKQEAAKAENSKIARSSSVQVSSSSSGSSGAMRPPANRHDNTYPSLDLVESKNSKKYSKSSNDLTSAITTTTTTSVKLQRSSTVITAGSRSSVESVGLRKESGSALSRASTLTSHDRRSENYKCIDVVRKRAERDALPGYTCFECEAFYEAMMQQGIMTEEGRKEHLRQCSRHKAKFTPPTTPEGFWDLTIHTPEEWK